MFYDEMIRTQSKRCLYSQQHCKRLAQSTITQWELSVQHRESRLLRHTHKKIAVNLGVMPKTYTKWCPLLPKVYAMAQNITVRLDSYMSTASCFIEFEKFLRCLSCSLTIDISMQQLCSRFSHFRYRTDLRERGFCKISLLLFIANEVWGEGAM